MPKHETNLTHEDTLSDLVHEIIRKKRFPVSAKEILDIIHSVGLFPTLADVHKAIRLLRHRHIIAPVAIRTNAQAALAIRRIQVISEQLRALSSKNTKKLTAFSGVRFKAIGK
jgi:hypothetical protein